MGAPKGNQYAIGNDGGKPPKYKDKQTLIDRINEYFIYVLGEYEDVEEFQPIIIKGKLQYDEFGCIAKNKVTLRRWVREPEPTTINGLTLFLGFANRQSLYDYQNNKKEYTGIIKKARALVEMAYEKTLHATGHSGAIFALKNMGWADKTELHSTGDGTAAPAPLVVVYNGNMPDLASDENEDIPDSDKK